MMSLQLLVALEDRLHAAGDVVVLLADVLRVEDAASSSRAGRRPGRCPSRRSTAESTMKASRKPKVVAGAGSVRSSAGTYTACTEVMAPLLVEVIRSCKRAHLGGQGRLVADVRRHPAQQGRDLGAGLAEPEDVVDEQQRVGPGRVAEPLGHRQGREGHAEPGAGRLVHLAEDTSTVLSMTDLPVLPILVSCISSQRSFPSRVRSPTPAKTE